MKTLILVLALGLSLQASASHWVQYDDKARQLLALVIKECPNEMIHAMSGANMITKAELVGGQMPVEVNGQIKGVINEAITIITSNNHLALSYDVAKLTIHREEIPEPIFVPSKPTEFKVTCKLESLLPIRESKE